MLTWKKRFGLAIAHGFEFYDIALYSAIIIYISHNFFPYSYFGEKSLFITMMIFSTRFIARPIGGFIIGVYADKYGRKKALIITSSLTGVATCSMACLPTYDHIGLLAPLLFFITQLMQCFAFGG